MNVVRLFCEMIEPSESSILKSGFSYLVEMVLVPKARIILERLVLPQ